MRRVVSILSTVFFLAISSTIALADIVPGALLYLDAANNPGHPDAWTNLGTAHGELPARRRAVCRPRRDRRAQFTRRPARGAHGAPPLGRIHRESVPRRQAARARPRARVRARVRRRADAGTWSDWWSHRNRSGVDRQAPLSATGETFITADIRRANRCLR